MVSRAAATRMRAVLAKASDSQVDLIWELLSGHAEDCRAHMETPDTAAETLVALLDAAVAADAG